MPPPRAHIPVVAGWSWPGPKLRAAGPAETERLAGLPHRSPGTLGADQAKHRERLRHGLDADCTHPTTPKRPCLPQGLGHQPQVGLGGNSHNHSLASDASPFNHAAPGPFIRYWPCWRRVPGEAAHRGSQELTGPTHRSPLGLCAARATMANDWATAQDGGYRVSCDAAGRSRSATRSTRRR